MEFYREYNPGFEYYFDHGPSSAQFNFGGGLAVAVTAILLAVLFAVLVFAAATYVLRSIGLYTMAKNRGIENAWLAWVPVGNSWLLGQIADEVNSRQGKKTNYSLILLVLTAVTAAGGFSLVLLPFSALLSAPLSLAASVVYFIALYDVYQDYAPKNAVFFWCSAFCFRPIGCCCLSCVTACPLACRPNRKNLRRLPHSRPTPVGSRWNTPRSPSLPLWPNPPVAGAPTLPRSKLPSPPGNVPPSIGAAL